MTAQEMVDMKLHETKEIGLGSCNIVLRVPGGWIYWFNDTAVFVPFDTEFINREYSELCKKLGVKE